MHKVNVFLILFAFSLVSLIAIYAIDVHVAATSPTHQSLFHDMWSHMTGGPSSTQSYLWVLPLLLIGIVIASTVGPVYFIAFPEIKMKPTSENEKNRTLDKKVPLSPFESVLKTLTPEERKVVNVLVAHEGRYLQKYLRKEVELSRLKTHRIVARLSERGIVSLKKSGNTNEVFLTDWLKDV